MPTRCRSPRALRCRLRPPATEMRATESWRIHLVHGDDREHAGSGDSRDRVKLAIDHPLGEAVPGRRHWGLLGPTIAFRIVGLIGMEDAAYFVDPAFAADCVNLTVERDSPDRTPRGCHGRARRPGVC